MFVTNVKFDKIINLILLKMNRFSLFFLLSGMLLFAGSANAQLSSSAGGQTTTAYASGPQDPVFVFCTSPGATAGVLTATFSSGAAATFEWSKFNSSSGMFETFQSDNSGATSSQISGLANGAYRVQATSGGTTEVYTAWVFNNWYEASASITENTCDYLQLTGSLTEQTLTYTDLTSGNTLTLTKNVQVKWEVGSDLLSSVISPRIYFPPAENTTYSLTVFDALGCSATASVYYESIVPKAAFVADPQKGEAPLAVQFTNQSVNGDSFEWFFFREKTEIELEAAAKGSVSDSIMDTGLDTNPVYTYENSGEYLVKLVATKTSTSATCRDTIYLGEYISVDLSAFEVPNVFTPNGDGANDYFVVKYTSMKSLSVKIFNRWGKQVFSVSRNNLGVYKDSALDAAWDGKIGGKYASPGVYYYVIEGVGRDDQRYKKAGYVHLFRGK